MNGDYNVVIKECIEDLLKNGIGYVFDIDQLKEIKETFPNAIIKYSGGIYEIIERKKLNE
jgi:hypothetical protein